MRRLSLIRHAKSDWGDPGLDDHDRSLNDRGLRDAPRMGKALAERGISPDAIISSTALRAFTTAKLMAKELGFPETEIRRESALYLPRPDQVLRVIQQIDEAHDCAILFGHNPGFHETAWELTHPGSNETVDQFPTCAVARFRLPIDFWVNAAFREGELVEFLTPKTL